MKEKDSEKVTPKYLSEMVLEYCEKEGYTLDEVMEVGNKIGNSARHIIWDNVAKNITYRRKEEEEHPPQKI